MKFYNRILAGLLVVVLLVAAVPGVSAAGSSKNATAGSSVTLTFTYNNIYGLTAEFSMNDPDGIVESWKPTGHTGGMMGNVDPKVFLFSTNATATSVTISVRVQLKGTAQPGQSATLTLSGAADYDAMGTDARSVTDTAKVTIIKNTTPVEPTPDPPPQVTVDYSVLERQIAIANGLNQGDYTMESWKVLTDALTKANNALSGKDQSAVDSAAKKLTEAIDALVRMDYTALEAVLQLVQSFVNTQELGELWTKLCDAVARGKALIGSGDQAAVDAAAQEIQTLLDELKVQIEANSTPEVIYKEVPVEVPPSSDFCNIPMHRIWPVLFFVSLGLNIALIVLLITVITRKKRKTDDTPLVDYDIDEDIE